ncbi:MAG: Putative Anti-sigma-factor antagonist [Nitrospira sp.]|nr:STAS domain-containing protein [Nitrospira sp.]ULA59033.1 MAG: Putative Anti-sigma-factor antagonist [Nitrospira sp.]
MTLKPVGDLTIFEVGALCEEVKQAAAAHPQVELDLSEIDKLDAAALQLLIAVRRSEHCVLTGMTDPIRARMTELGA